MAGREPAITLAHGITKIAMGLYSLRSWSKRRRYHLPLDGDDLPVAAYRMTLCHSAARDRMETQP
jgi:hypothetical protein